MDSSPRVPATDASSPHAAVRSGTVAAVARSLLFCLLASNSGCVYWTTTGDHDVALEVFDRQTGERLPEWVVESTLQSDKWGAATAEADHTFETTLRLVMARSPGNNTYHVEAFTNWSEIALLNPFWALYGGATLEERRIYAVGYEIGDDRARDMRKWQQIRKRGELGQPDLSIGYALSPWINDRTNPAVIEILSMLEDKDNFRPYEALRGTPKGTGVPAIYRYYVERYKAIVQADPDLSIKPGVKATVAWLEDEAAGKVARSPWASPTTVRRMPDRTTPERIFRIIAEDVETKKRIDSWIIEIDRVIDTGLTGIHPIQVAKTDGKPMPAEREVLAVDSRMTASPDTRMPPFINADRRNERTIRFSACLIVYSVGYEPHTISLDTRFFETNNARNKNTDRIWPFDSIYVPDGTVIQCRLHKWDNRDARTIRDFGTWLEDDERFAQYEQLRRQGAAAVPDLYRYFLSRYDALDSAGQGRLSEKARQRVTWLRQQVK